VLAVRETRSRRAFLETRLTGLMAMALAVVCASARSAVNTVEIPRYSDCYWSSLRLAVTCYQKRINRWERKCFPWIQSCFPFSSFPKANGNIDTASNTWQKAIV
jgi:hypothetical protein